MDKWYWLTEESRKFLSRGYLENQKAEERVIDMAVSAEEILGIEGFAGEFVDYASKGYYTFATPVWCNFGKPRKLPISCYGSYIQDTMDSILNGAREIGMMSKYGGGTSAYLGKIRERGASISTGGNADGPVHYAKIYETIIDRCKQGKSRRGACAIYIDIYHKDIMEFLKIGTEGNDIQKLQIGINIPDWWMEQMIAGDLDKRKVWARVIELKKETGFPYFFFTDNVNKGIWKELGLKVNHSNLCTEIINFNDKDHSFVCCVGSVNLLHWEEMIKTRAIEFYYYFLSAVNQDFINKASKLPGMGRAKRFAERFRSIGMGVVGYHSYLQSQLIEFESLQAKSINNEIFKTLDEKTRKASSQLYKFNSNFNSERKGYSSVNCLAIAPTKSSSFILDQVSMGIEPIKSNYFIKDLAKSKTVYKNPYLTQELDKYKMNNPEVWESILENDGSCQHLDFPTKKVFKSFIEISPKEIILQAAQRQQYIDQSQSLNLAIHPSVSIKDINKLYIYAWKEGIKTIYYQFNTSAARSFAKEINECSSCEG